MEHSSKQVNKPITLFLLGCLTGVVITVVSFVVALQFVARSTSESPTEAQLQAVGSSANTAGSGLASIERSEVVYPYCIRGRVTDTRGDPIFGAVVSAFSDEYPRSLEGTSDGSGHFEIGNLPLGIYTVEARAEGFTSAIESGVAPDGPQLELVLQARADLVGRVLFEGEPVSEAAVFIGGPGLFPPMVVVTDEGGWFLVDGFSPQAYLELVAVGRDVGSGFGTIVSLSAHNQVQVETEASVPLGLDIFDAVSGERVGSGIYTVSGNSLQLLSIAGVFERGMCELIGFPPQSLYLRVQAAGYLPWSGSIEHDGSPQAIPLQPGGQISGRVVGVRGEAISGAQLSVTVRDELGGRWRLGNPEPQPFEQLLSLDGSPLWPPRVDLVSGEDGTFHISGLPGGQVILEVSSEGYRTATVTDLDIERDQLMSGVEIRLDAAEN